MHTMQIKTLINRIDEDILKEEGLLHLTANEPYMSELAKKYLSNRLGDRYGFLLLHIQCNARNKDGKTNIILFEPSPCECYVLF